MFILSWNRITCILFEHDDIVGSVKTNMCWCLRLYGEKVQFWMCGFWIPNVILSICLVLMHFCGFWSSYYLGTSWNCLWTWYIHVVGSAKPICANPMPTYMMRIWESTIQFSVASEYQPMPACVLYKESSTLFGASLADLPKWLNLDIYRPVWWFGAFLSMDTVNAPAAARSNTVHR
jgi:hypothetical protein